jgi:hypothetical protein
MTSLDSLDIIAINAALFILKLDRAITYSRVEDDGERVVVSLPTAYLRDDPNGGYDAETEARGRKINAALGECGLRFSDAGCEEGGEYWMFVARA